MVVPDGTSSSQISNILFRNTTIGSAIMLDNRKENLLESIAVDLVSFIFPAPYDLIIVGAKTVVKADANDKISELTWLAIPYAALTTVPK